MTDGQFTALLGVIAAAAGSIAGVIRWAITRLTKASDDNTAAQREGHQLQLQVVEGMAILSTKIDRIDWYVDQYTPIDNPKIEPMPTTMPDDEITRPHPRRVTPARGVGARAQSEYSKVSPKVSR